MTPEGLPSFNLRFGVESYDGYASSLSFSMIGRTRSDLGRTCPGTVGSPTIHLKCAQDLES